MWQTQIESEYIDAVDESSEEVDPDETSKDAALTVPHRLQKISILSDNKPVSYSQVIQLWQQNQGFRTFWLDILASTPMKAYFWETPPLSQSTLDQAFEFVLVNSSRLAEISPDSSDFQSHFKSATKEVVTFANLGKDAQLVVPSPIGDESAYTHIAAFVRKAPRSQQHQLWQTVSEQIQQKLTQQPMWVSTSGLGVAWLHIRLDSHPKYYTYEPYRSF